MIVNPFENISENIPECLDCSFLKQLRIRNINRLIIGNLNINSIANKFDELKIFIHTNIDILVITETKIDSSFPLEQFYISGFSKPFRLDRNKNGGGLLIFVRNDISAKELKQHKKHDDIETIFIEINLIKVRWVLCGCYHPPRQSDQYFFDHIRNALDIYLKYFDKFLLIGDFNTEDTEPCLSDLLYEYEAKNIVKEKTCFKSILNPTCIDLFITNCPQSFQNTKALSTGLSDFHKMVVTVMKMTYKKEVPSEIYYRDYKSFDPFSFKNALENKISENHNKGNSYDDFENKFMEVINKHIPLKRKLLRANHAPYMTKLLRKAIMRRSQLETRYLKNKTNENLVLYKKQKNFCSKLYKKERKKYYNNLEMKNITDNKTFWKTVKPFISKNVCFSDKILIEEDGEIISEDLQLCEKFSDYFENIVNDLSIVNNEYNCSYNELDL